jgi:hypothetical protein
VRFKWRGKYPSRWCSWCSNREATSSEGQTGSKSGRIPQWTDRKNEKKHNLKRKKKGREREKEEKGRGEAIDLLSVVHSKANSSTIGILKDVPFLLGSTV